LKSYVRVDFFVTTTNDVYFNEINNLPWLSPSSILIKLWESKYTYVELLQHILTTL